MLIFWRIQCLHRQHRTFSHRDLFLDTSRLDPSMRAAVELTIETASFSRREVLHYRHLFRDDASPDATAWRARQGDRFESCLIPNYIEDENGVEISPWDFGPVVTGDPKAILLPYKIEPHVLELRNADPDRIPLEGITLSDEEFKQLSFFSRDLRELLRSSLLADGPGSLTSRGNLSNPSLVTAVTHDEIVATVSVFRRLYMEKEPGNFAKAANVLTKYLHQHPLGKWVAGERKTYLRKLDTVPDSVPQRRTLLTFTRRQVLDAFIYTQYAHQPRPDSEQLFKDCLRQTDGDMHVLTWLFLIQLWECSLEIKQAGRFIAEWFRKYCEHNKVSTDVLPSVVSDIPGLGTKERKTERNARVLQRKAEELAEAMWKDKGCPDGGPTAFFSTARKTIEQARI